MADRRPHLPPPAAPDLPRALEPLDAAAPADGDEWALGRITGLVAPEAAAKELRLDAVVVERADLRGARLDRLRVVDSVLDDCDAANVASRGAALTRAELRACRMTGLRLTGAELRDVTFAGCRLDLASLGGAQAEHVRFEGCVLREAALSGARWSSVAFVDCDLTGADLTDAVFRTAAFDGCDLTDADLTGARFELADLRGCRLDGARGLLSLRGTRMSRADMLAAAPELAAAIGIRELPDQ